MRKTVFLCVLIITLLAMISAACADETEVVIYGRGYINGQPANKSAEGLFSFELLYDDMTPVMDGNGTPVQAVNGPDGSFEFKFQLERGNKSVFYVREIADSALDQIYTLDTAAHPVTVETDGNGGYTVSPDPVKISNQSLLPDTGDTTSLFPLIALNILSALAVVTLILRRRRAE